MASAHIREDASISSYLSRVSSVRVNTPFKSTRSESGARKDPTPTRREPTVRREDSARRESSAISHTKYYPQKFVTPSPPCEKLTTPGPSTTKTASSDAKSGKTMKYRYTKTLLLFLVLGTCGVVGLSVRAHGRVLQHVGVMSALSFMGVVADPELQAKISDLSKQIEDLQKMVTMLIPQQQEKIDLLEQKQDEQRQKQLEQEQRDNEQQEAEKRRKEEEVRRLEEERKREEERQRALELEKIQQLEMQKKQLELEIKIKQEEEKRKQWREEVKRREEEKTKRDEEEARMNAEEEERKKEEKEAAEIETAEQAATETESGDVCSLENDDVCEAQTLSSVIEDTVEDSIAVAKAKEEWDELIRELEEEKVRLKAEINSWEDYRENEVKLSQLRSSEVLQRLDLASEIEQKAAAESELVKALSEEMLAKFAELKKENSALKERISSLETGLTDKLDTITSELAALRKQVEEEPEADGNTSGTNLQEVQDLISKSLKLYAADEVGMPDFALESSGAVVFTIGETEPYTRDTPWMGVFGISIWRSCKTPRLAIQKDNSPGNCWSFTGDKGSLTIQLSAQVFPEHFTVDHIPLELAPNGNASSAPYYFRVLGLDYGNAPKGHVLGNYEFTEFPIQTFAVQQNPYEKYFRFVKVEILSNHGNKDYTCLYRFRVHGRPHDTDTYNG